MQNLVLDAAMQKLRMPGATLTTRLKVYDTPTPDGQRGGTPHIHLMCTEMYFVTAGSGAVELMDMNGFQTVELVPHAALVFSPGTIHRLINPNGDLDIFVIMQNSGLPERGDNFPTFNEEWLSSDEKFAEAMQVQTIEDAYRRRDRGVDGFIALKAAFEESDEKGRAALQRFYDLCAVRSHALRQEWRDVVEKVSLAAVQDSLDQLDALDNADTAYLSESRHFAVYPDDHGKLGFCGHLDRYFDPATLAMEGVTK